jgi:molybdopterin-guanine dinucleotide biosynthesis protein A/molybdopterin converting factor small subunit
MGQSKALLPFDGEPLIVHVVATLRRLFADIVVVAAPDQELPEMPVTLVRDAVAYQGPVGGLAYGLTAAKEDVAFVTATDSAFLNADLIAHLVSQIQHHDVVVPHWEGRFQPLHAVYRRSVLPLLEAQLIRGDLRPVSLFDNVITRTVDEEEIRRFDPDGASFFNMNTPEAYAEALVRWHDRRCDRAATSGGVSCTVELFGVARMTAQTAVVALDLPPGATLGHVFQALVDQVPALIGRVLDPATRRLTDGYTSNINGRAFTRDPSTPIRRGDAIVILSADAGG